MSIAPISTYSSHNPAPICWSNEEEPESPLEESRATDIPVFDPSINLAASLQILPYVEETEGMNIIMLGWELGMDFRFTPFDSVRALSFDYQLSLNYMSAVSGLTSAPQALGLRHALGITARSAGLSLGFYVTYEDAFTILRQEAHYSFLGASASFELEVGDFRPYFEYTWLENLESGWSARIHQVALGVKGFIF